MRKLVLVESEGLLYRGLSADHPIEIWDYPRKRWVSYEDAGRKRKGWGRQISSARANRLKKDNPDAEHFAYYDIPPWLQPPSQAWLDAVLPDLVKKHVAKVRSRL
jgi:hypothetical protein